MANSKSKQNDKNINNKKENNNKNNFIMKTLVFLGVIVFSFIIIYLMYYFFVKESDIKINISTDKQMEYITLEGQEELIMTQKYVSDLEYSMRYDVNLFKVFKYKEQDIYKFLEDERVLVVVEKSTLPSNCASSSIETEYNNCLVTIDDFTSEYYISSNAKTYKITIKSPSTPEYEEGVKARINYMINSFKMTN